MDDYTPRYTGNTSNPLRATFTDHLGAVYDLSGLTGAAIQLKLYNTSSEISTTGTGTWTIVDAANGIAQYSWMSADVATAGTYKIEVTITFADGPLTFDPKILEINSK